VTPLERPLSTEVSWEPPAPGAFTRQLRFGEWIGAPVTPLFESWLLPAMEERLHQKLYEWIGQRAPRPHHVVVNGWYFYSLNWIGGRALLGNLPRLLGHLVRDPRRIAGLAPQTAHLAIPSYLRFERAWRDDLSPRYRRAVAEATSRVETAPPGALSDLVDALATLAGEYFASFAAVGGAAYKLEMGLAAFHRRHLASETSDSHLPLLAGLAPPDAAPTHAIASLDWADPPLPVAAASPDAMSRVVDALRSAESAAADALAASPRRLRTFRTLLADAQHFAGVREEQARELTIAWPIMRRAVVRIGEAIAATGAIADPDDVFFLTRDEVHALLEGRADGSVDVVGRRARRDAAARLVPPLLVGSPGAMLRRLWERFPAMVGARPSADALVTGSPAAAGRATGLVRVIRSPDEFDELLDGEILVAPMTAPAWTPLFARAVAVVTDVGSAASHASIIAREYGIPAVVGCGDATSRLRTGQCVTVDGGTGNVMPGPTIGT
jgi:rifampicin phosphotransferase